MRSCLLRRVLVCFMAALSLTVAGIARAEITCSGVSMSDISFGEFNPLGPAETTQTTLRYSCSNDNADPTPNSSALLCFSLQVRNPYMGAKGNNRLYFNVYQDPAMTILWGSQYDGAQYGIPLRVAITLPAGAADVPFTAPVYSVVPQGQLSAEPAAYTATYGNGDTRMTLESVPGDAPPVECGKKSVASFPFLVSANISPQCIVSAGQALDFGNVEPGARLTTGRTSMGVTCTLKTPYNIGLSPSNGSVTGEGLMTGSRSANADRIPYQLSSTPGPNGVPWGNLVSPTNAGNGVSGEGVGTSQVYTIYATVPDASYAPDSYSDTVTVMVYY